MHKRRAHRLDRNLAREVRKRAHDAIDVMRMAPLRGWQAIGFNQLPCLHLIQETGGCVRRPAAIRRWRVRHVTQRGACRIAQCAHDPERVVLTLDKAVPCVAQHLPRRVAGRPGRVHEHQWFAAGRANARHRPRHHVHRWLAGQHHHAGPDTVILHHAADQGSRLVAVDSIG